MVKKGLSLGCRLEQLEETLKFAQTAGVEAVELSIEQLQLIFNGALHPARTEMAVGILRQFPFEYSVHQPRSLDLRNIRAADAVNRLFSSVQEFCSMIGSRILVVHYEKESFPQEEQLLEQLLLKAANRTDQVVLAIENIEIERSSKVADLVRRLDHQQIKMT
ncbi:hypothetical protein GC098_19375 [Paenibacillus sp. LMG 31458]|uniref:Xylose isomerase-like TIM barrel domain-containing protein n=1 Tax=Paenibacillus phytorum TaxID=2654977 RepID=A0ABX1XYA0_9BACL|nr:hypothetical protein [Paenibacillus phytorum]NOU73555.1 hypothetical protein [Paenibacillus phytorum]